MSDKEELLKQLLGSLDADDLERLVSMTKEESKPKGPRRSVLTNKVLDNSEFESIRRDLARRIPMEEKPYLEEEKGKNRIQPFRREGVEKVKANCERCSKTEWVFASEINSLVDNTTVYLCEKCSKKTRT